ncbi:MAG: triose-phosphate isomerase family protein [Acidithiobacillus sp.]
MGHSERRALFGESDAVVLRKAQAALHSGLIPVICVGETGAEREHGKTTEVLRRQIEALAPVLEHQGSGHQPHVVIAYEPVWAIGTGQTATPEQAQEAHAFIRAVVAEHAQALAKKLLILYGGSVKANNAAALFAAEDIDGGLVGGASLQAGEFIQICRAAHSVGRGV